jgi:hypothetical protein
MGANYRNYSILSQAVRDTSNPGRAIEASLKQMQEAQKAIMLSLNTVETNRPATQGSGPVNAYGDAHVVSSPSSVGHIAGHLL